MLGVASPEAVHRQYRRRRQAIHLGKIGALAGVQSSPDTPGFRGNQRSG
jgi:hypothetical protein